MIIKIEINDDVPSDEVSYILRRLAHDIDITNFPPSYCGKKRSSVRVFDSNGAPVGTVKFGGDGMKITQDLETGKLIIDGEGEVVKCAKVIPADPILRITNFYFDFEPSLTVPELAPESPVEA